MKNDEKKKNINAKKREAIKLKHAFENPHVHIKYFKLLTAICLNVQQMDIQL